MKFLGPQADSMDLMILNIIYYEGEKGQKDDVLYVVYKDINTRKKYVETIHNPKVEVYIVRKEYRNFNYFKDYIHKDYLDKVTVSYKFKTNELAKIMDMNWNEIKYCPYILGSDLNIESYYMSYFIKEYSNDKPKPLSVGFFDIESDIIEFQEGEFAPIGEPPINAVSYIDYDTKHVYGLFLRNDKNQQIKEVELNLDNILESLHEKFDEAFPNYEYSIRFFDNEIELIISLIQLFIACNNDYILAWNLPYDIMSIISRISKLGYDPRDILHDCNNFEIPICEFRNDDNVIAHKRRQVSKISIMPVFIDFLVLYAGIRSAGPKLPSLKLSFIAKKELNDDKYDYSEVASLRTLPYVDYVKFMFYNIKDTLLLAALHEVTNDINELYIRCSTDGLMPYEIFTSTAMLTGSLRLFIEKNCNMIMGNNRNKIFKNDKSNQNKYTLIDEDDEWEFDIFGEEMDEDDDEETSDNNKKKKFSGAYVSNPTRMLSTGLKINGSESNYVHNNIIDQDITSEYPTSMIIMNLSNETLVGKMFFKEPEKVDIPMYSYMLQDEEAAEYKCKPEVLFMEMLSECQYENMGSLFFSLPSTDEVIRIFENELGKESV